MTIPLLLVCVLSGFQPSRTAVIALAPEEVVENYLDDTKTDQKEAIELCDMFFLPNDGDPIFTHIDHAYVGIGLDFPTTSDIELQ